VGHEAALAVYEACAPDADRLVDLAGKALDGQRDVAWVKVVAQHVTDVQYRRITEERENHVHHATTTTAGAVCVAGGARG
jgi:hypothetical protein